MQKRRRQRAQALTEFMLAAPMLAVFLFATLDTGVYVLDRVTANHAVRQGARIAAELGGALTNPGQTNVTLDPRIVGDVQAVASALDFSFIQQIDIYKPTSADGSLQGTDLQDNFDGNGVQMGASPMSYTLDQRLQIPPNETLIGVRLVWVYSPPSGVLPGPSTQTSYAVFRVSPWRAG